MRGGPGRKKGVPNKATVEVREWAQSVLEDAEGRRKTLELYRRGRLAPGIVAELFNRAYGKVKDTLQIDQPRPLVVELLEHAETPHDPDAD